jgi:hypothetical protein
LANFILEKNSGEMLIFHRLLLAAPIGLASIVAGIRFTRSLPLVRASWGFAAVIAGLIAFTVASPAQPFYNRLWHLLCVTPSDQSLASESASVRQMLAQWHARDPQR